MNINEYRPPCPVIFFEKANGGQKQIFTIHCERLEVDIECYVSTAIINMRGKWTNRTNDTLDCVFALPTPGTIMNVTLNIGDKLLNTAIIPSDDANKLIEEQRKNQKVDLVPEQQSPYEQYAPDLFRLPFGNVQPDETIDLQCQYLETLNYYKKGYIVSIPLFFPSGTIVENLSWEQVVSVSCKINALSADTIVECFTHQIQKTQENDTVSTKILGIKEIDRDNNKPSGDEHPMYTSEEPLKKTGRDFELSYTVKSEKIVAHCIRSSNNSSSSSSSSSENDEKSEKSDEEETKSEDMGSLCIFVTPPSTLQTTFGRSFYFLLDRSGSMIGEPYSEAIRALGRAIDKLRPKDQFNICVFDHRQVYFSENLVEASKQKKKEAESWVLNYSPERGGTIMDKPIEIALECLEKSDLLPFLVIITDGAVPNEREICSKIEKRLESKSLKSRILTLGIGSYCNWFYLKMLSKIGRGFSDVVVYKEHIYGKMDHLLRMANTPVLTDIEIGVDNNVKELELYPYPIPDLFIHAPIVVAARYKTSAKIPSTVSIRGYNPHAKIETYDTKIVTTNLPVDKIFIKQQIDLLTAQAWFKESKKIENKVVNLSVQHSIPSPYTSLIAFEVDRTRLNEQNADENGQDDEKSNKSKKILQSKNNSKAKVAAIAVGGTIAVVAASAMAFGSVQDTIANIPVLSGGLDMDLDCCQCDCDCDCDCDDCADCGDCTIQ